MALRGILFSLLHFDLVDLSLAEGAEAAESSTRFLRGRQLQTDSQRLVQAQCKPGDDSLVVDERSTSMVTPFVPRFPTSQVLVLVLKFMIDAL